MRAILIPVKDLTQAKQRLAGLLPQEERTALARAMLEDVFSAVAATRGADAVFVISSDAPALARARGLGWEIFPEHQQISESHSVDEASRQCEVRGVRALLRLPIDIPLVESRDIEALLDAAAEGTSVVLVPSRDGSGTNALLRTPPRLFPSHFGPGSLARHLDEAGRVGAHARVIRNPRIELDIDDEADLRAFFAVGGQETATSACLRRLGVDGRTESRAALQQFEMVEEPPSHRR
jgi:2-phospho-L-lactate guanylyltransferase